MRVRVVTVVQFSERSCVVTMQAADVLVASGCLLQMLTPLSPILFPSIIAKKTLDMCVYKKARAIKPSGHSADPVQIKLVWNRCRGALVNRAAGVANLMDISATVQFNDNDRLVVHMYTQMQCRLPVISCGSPQCFYPVCLDVALPHVTYFITH